MIDERADSDWANLKSVAPFTGAWIEIGCCLRTESACQRSRTLHGCVDWNSASRASLAMSMRSHPSRVRGLKYRQADITDTPVDVAPFTGAWIEIKRHKEYDNEHRSRTLHGCVDWNLYSRSVQRKSWKSRTLHGCVDWTLILVIIGTAFLLASKSIWCRKSDLGPHLSL